ncbi:MAG: AAA family ATPase, partial [Parachlamydia sp.]|nr:AAA family ATPase [Parachlamydia sp.]
MLKHLRIQNLILIENASISFHQGLHILTGETGSGKSALIHALKLILGGRAESSIIRKGSDKGIVEAVFDLSSLPKIPSLLFDCGIDHDSGQDLVIRREISASGKGRIFVNHQLSQAAFLRKLGNLLILVVEQSSHVLLQTLDYHRHALDLYGDHALSIAQFQSCYQSEWVLQKKLEDLVQAESQRLREIAICERECKELEEAELRLNEDEELFSEYTLLYHAEELSENINEVMTALSGDKQNLLGQIAKQKNTLERLLAYDVQLSEPAEGLNNALLELQEVFHSLRGSQARLNHDPERLQAVNERLTQINFLTK